MLHVEEIGKPGDETKLCTDIMLFVHELPSLLCVSCMWLLKFFPTNVSDTPSLLAIFDYLPINNTTSCDISIIGVIFYSIHSDGSIKSLALQLCKEKIILCFTKNIHIIAYY